MQIKEHFIYDTDLVLGVAYSIVAGFNADFEAVQQY